MNSSADVSNSLASQSSDVAGEGDLESKYICCVKIFAKYMTSYKTVPHQM